MENKVNFYQGMDIDPDDFNNLQTYTQGTFDDLVGDAVTSGQKYAGFLVTKSSATAVTIGKGRLISGGKIYGQTVQTTQDFLTTLPVAGQKIVTVALLGTEIDDEVTEREFLINEDTGAAQPKPVAMTHRRIATVSFAYGQEAPTAVPIILQSGYTKLADILLTTGGVSSITMYATNGLQSIDSLDQRATSLERFEDLIGPEVSTLTSGFASLANALKNATSQSLITRMLLSIATLNSKVGIPTTAADSSIDYLLDATNSDLTHSLSNCKVMEGIRFADNGASDAVLNLLNPFETNGVVKNGVLFPTYSRYLRNSIGPVTGSVSAASFTYNAVNYTQKTMARTRVRYGAQYTVCSNSQFWHSGTYDPLSSTFTLPTGETFKVALDVNAGVYSNGTNGDDGSHIFVRIQQFWTDTVSDTYWDAVVQAPQSIAGYHMFETTVVGQDHWLDAVGVYFPTVDTQGDVTLLICGADDNARPLPSTVIAKVTIPFSSLKGGQENVFSLANPVLLSAGTRVSYGIVTTGGHTLGMTDGANFGGGTFFVLSPSGYAQGDLTKHMCLNFYGTKFLNSVVSLQLQNLQLAGGMTAIDILAASVVPDSTTLTYEIQLAGVWTPLNGDTVASLNAGGSLPPNVPLRATFAGTSDMMPCLGLTNSTAHVSRPNTTFAHVWPKLPRTPPVATSQIRVIERFESFDSGFHSFGCKLLTGTGYLTQTAASSFSDKIDGTAIERTYVFNLGAAVASYKVLTTGTTSTPLKTFHGAWIKDYVL